MRICDACKGSERVQSIQLKITNPIKENDYDVTIDLCGECIKYAHPNSFTIGIKEIRNHEVKK
jgi:hypothetical protein